LRWSRAGRTPDDVRWTVPSDQRRRRRRVRVPGRR
jgi:hypothetical protein